MRVLEGESYTDFYFFLIRRLALILILYQYLPIVMMGDHLGYGVTEYHVYYILNVIDYPLSFNTILSI